MQLAPWTSLRPRLRSSVLAHKQGTKSNHGHTDLFATCLTSFKSRGTTTVMYIKSDVRSFRELALLPLRSRLVCVSQPFSLPCLPLSPLRVLVSSPAKLCQLVRTRASPVRIWAVALQPTTVACAAIRASSVLLPPASKPLAPAVIYNRQSNLHNLFVSPWG